MRKKANSEPSTCSQPWGSFLSSQLLSSPGTFQMWGLSFLVSSQTLWFCITYVLLHFALFQGWVVWKGGGGRQREAMWIPPIFVSAWGTCSSHITITSVMALLILLLKHPWGFFFFRADEWEEEKQNKLKAAARNPREVLALLPWDSFLSLWLERPSLQAFFATWCVLLGFGAQK